MALTDTAIRAAKARAKPWKLADGGGLFLLIHPNGSRYWRMKYRANGREKALAFGVYPEVSLKDARIGRDKAREQLRSGCDPAVQAQIAKVAQADTFEAVALEWLHALAHPPQRPNAKKPPRPALCASTVEHKRTWLDKFVFPYIGQRPIAQIDAPELLAVLRRVEKHGIFETTHRVRSTCGRIFRYGIATSKCTRDISADLCEALQPVVVTHHAALTEPLEIGAMLRAIADYHGQPPTRAALRLLPLVFVRSSELRYAEWSEFDLDGAEWRIPGRRMKMKLPHVVPLARQAIEILRELLPLTGEGRLVFPALTSRARPISENTINAALRRLGYTPEQMTGHGFRTVARTLLGEMGYAKETIRIQLAHKNPDDVDDAYNRAELLAVRRLMMQAWADYLDGLRAGGSVTTLHAKRA